MAENAWFMPNGRPYQSRRVGSQQSDLLRQPNCDPGASTSSGAGCRPRETLSGRRRRQEGSPSVPAERPYQSRCLGSQQSQLLMQPNRHSDAHNSSTAISRLGGNLNGRRRRQENPAADTRSCICPTAALLSPPTYCQKRGAKKFQYETKIFCYSDRQVIVAGNPYPAELIRLFISDDQDAQHFRRYCHLYNNMFAFCSLGGSITSTVDKGIFVLKIHGQIYHYVPDLVPGNGKPCRCIFMTLSMRRIIGKPCLMNCVQMPYLKNCVQKSLLS